MNTDWSSIETDLVKQGDIFSLGVILFYLFYQDLPWTNAYRKDLINITKKDYEESLKRGIFTNKKGVEISDEAKDLITKMLEVNPSKRITMEEIRKHDYYKGIEKQPQIDPQVKILLQDFKNKLREKAKIIDFLQTTLNLLIEQEHNFFKLSKLEWFITVFVFLKDIAQLSKNLVDAFKGKLNDTNEWQNFKNIFEFFKNDTDYMTFEKKIYKMNENALKNLSEFKEIPKLEKIFLTNFEHFNQIKIENQIINMIKKFDFANDARISDELVNLFWKMTNILDAEYMSRPGKIDKTERQKIIERCKNIKKN